jgi:hypothetical protein
MVAKTRPCPLRFIVPYLLQLLVFCLIVTGVRLRAGSPQAAASAAENRADSHVPANRYIRVSVSHLQAGQEAQTFPVKKNFLLPPFFSSRTVRDRSVTRPCFLFIRCLPVPGRQDGRWSAPVTHQDQGNGAILVKESSPAPGKFTCPRKLPACARQTGRYHALSSGSGCTDPVAPFRVQPLYGSRRLPVLGRQVGVPADHNPCELYLRDGTAANQTLWF